MLRDGGTTSADRVRFGFLAVVGREPTPRETSILAAGLERNLAHYQSQRDAATKLTAIGERPRDPALDVSLLAAHTATASLILNLDEAVTRE